MAQISCGGSKLSYCRTTHDQFPQEYRALWDFFDSVYEERSNDESEWLYIADTDERHSYSSIYKKAQKFAKGLMAMGLEKGETLFMTGIEGSDLMALFIGGMSIGAILSNVAVRQPRIENATRIMQKIEPSVIVLGPYQSATEEFMSGIFCDFPEVKAIHSVRHILIQSPESSDLSETSNVKPLDGLLTLADSISDDALMDRKRSVSAHDPAFVTLSTGSTGAPKGIVLPNASLLSTVPLMYLSCENVKDSIMGSIQPQQDDMLSLIFTISSLHAGMKMVVFPRTQHNVGFLRVVLGYVERERITILFLPAFFWQLLLNNRQLLSEFNLSCLTGGLLSGQVISGEFRKELLTLFPTILTGYGMSEINWAVAMPSSATVEEKYTYTGKPLPNVECLVVDSNDVVVPVGEQGELWVRGPGLLLYYKDDPQKTAEFKRQEDGWAKTGDMAFMNPDGFISVLGRKSDALRMKVLNCVVYPSPIENALRKHPAISECCVVGHHSDLIGDELVYCIIPNTGESLTVESVTEWSKANMYSDLWWPVRIHFFDEFPTVGPRAKLDRRWVTANVADHIKQDSRAGWTGAVTNT